ncbi:hypothetical protein B0A58_14655 [Flavobacterium branchiophilum NBRC 15030 = ATCC 35035]|uniref:Uncharacterized protein n=1 Tax=Flavobacterium branchiophilum TaxID=55197 RepID=A0A543G4A5_9FLAO|nr:hypothetical protein [Flavobacterium branchiophilum]OXA70287.1 hypothetical protein B0A58_14655 [Flavobacterium branchiophilum NBRC 15030 = ATCC 35035]TQM40918.1 hypothetical protein BC670_1838 [Flavobacterium branchiophilum]GEM56600.1 hypothetical protein FB1_28210 [Flavobacterium branchiophilum NBRC 15030 = ATCC 35035]
MKNLILIVFCLFSFTTFAQQKKATKSKAKTTVSIKNKAVKINTICGLCKGTGKDPKCNGTGLCQNHHTTYLDVKCFNNCDCYDGGDDIGDEPETADECTTRCEKECQRSQLCGDCDSYDGTCKKMWCNNGVCRNCNGKGKVSK